MFVDRLIPNVVRSILLAGLVIAAYVPRGHTQPPVSQPAQPPRPPGLEQVEDRKARLKALMLTTKGAQYLLSAQEKDGGWASETGPGVSALVLKALLRQPGLEHDHSAIQRGVAFVLKFQRDDGGIYSAEGLLKNYESSVALSMLAALGDQAHAPQIAALQKFLKDKQWDESEDKSPDDVWYGGAGYGRHERPDLSNTQMMLEALRDSGLPPDDPAYQKALIFIQRCQMLGEKNDQPFAKGSVEGGFIYTPANGGESKAGRVDIDGRLELRCYGSMTYAGLKSMLYAGLSKDDPRVQAAVKWLQAHWSLDRNPNMPDEQSGEGLFYFYHVFGRALDAWGAPVIEDKYRREHNWRRELVAKLDELQRPDGSWVNSADRYMEGIPALTTAYAMLALQAAYPPGE